jgi:chemosensory pili system protein ChpA (sensor histidine kinase/response regulator)
MTIHAMTSSTADAVSDFDVGPLSWVQVEIGLALSRGQDLLAAFRVTPTDLSLLRQARNQIHQAVGAIQMVGLDAAVAYTDELERQIGRLEQMRASISGRPVPRSIVAAGNSPFFSMKW